MNMVIHIYRDLEIGEDELEYTAIRSPGKGGQNVNKVSTAICLRFDIPSSSLPPEIRSRLLECGDQRINNRGVLVIKSHGHRSQRANRREAENRLREFVARALYRPARRISTKPGRSAVERRLTQKKRRGHIKRLRGSADPD